jgi:hypothetical protein
MRAFLGQQQASDSELSITEEMPQSNLYRVWPVLASAAG